MNIVVRPGDCMDLAGGAIRIRNTSPYAWYLSCEPLRIELHVDEDLERHDAFVQRLQRDLVDEDLDEEDCC